MVLLGRPKNGDIVRAQLRIKESKEFKVSAMCNSRNCECVKKVAKRAKTFCRKIFFYLELIG